MSASTTINWNSQDWNASLKALSDSHMFQSISITQNVDEYNQKTETLK